MRILLVTLSDLLPVALNSVLNPANEYCAIVVDDLDKVKNFSEKLSCPLYPFYDLKECIADFHYDCLLCVSNSEILWSVHRQFIDYSLPLNKFVHVCLTNGANNDFLVERTLRYYKEHAELFDIVATGISYTAVALDADKFNNHKLFNFGRSSQDLYYDYKIAETILKAGGGGRIRYALIGLGHQSFHYDLSKSYGTAGRFLQYVIAFDDLHNFWMSKEDYKRLFNPNYLSFRLKAEVPDINNVYFEKTPLRFIPLKNRIEARNIVDNGNKAGYSETCRENAQILTDYVALCENNNVRPIIFLPPMSAGRIKHFSRRKLDEIHYFVHEAQKKHSSAVFIDGWKLKGFLDTDFYDLDHLNIQGAAKFSSILNALILQLDKIPLQQNININY